MVVFVFVFIFVKDKVVWADVLQDRPAHTVITHAMHGGCHRGSLVGKSGVAAIKYIGDIINVKDGLDGAGAFGGRHVSWQMIQ